MKQYYMGTMFSLRELVDTGLSLMAEVENQTGEKPFSFQFSSGLPRNDYGSTFRIYSGEDINQPWISRTVTSGIGYEVPILQTQRGFIMNKIAQVIHTAGANVNTQRVTGLTILFFEEKMYVNVDLQVWSPPTQQEIFSMMRIAN